MSCTQCNDTGSLSKNIDADYLDCGYCDIAQERAALETWAARQGVQYGSESSLWTIYQHGKAATASQNQ